MGSDIEVIVGRVEMGGLVGCMGTIVDFCDRRKRIESMRNRKKIIEPMANHFAAFFCPTQSFFQKVGLLRSFSLGEGNSFSFGGGICASIKLSFHRTRFVSRIFIFFPVLHHAFR